MNILLLNWRDPHNPLSGGAEYVTLEHAKGWVRHGDTVTWFTSIYRQAPSQEVLQGVHIIRRGSRVSVFFYAMLYYLFHRNEVDVIVDEVHGIPFFAVLYARVPVVLFIHEVAGDIWDVMYSKSIGIVGKLLERYYLYLYRKNLVWTDAQSTVDELEHLGVSRALCYAIACPITINPATYKPAKEKELTCIVVSRMVRMKRVEDVIVAFSDVVNTFPRSTLWLVGGGDESYVASLHDLVKKYNLSTSMTWYGKVSEKKKLSLLSRAHILLHTSVKEGWGLVVLEAASQYTPSIVYGVAGLADTVKNGKTGIIIPSCTPHDLSREIIALYSNKTIYTRMQNNAHIWSRSFRWKAVITQSRELLYKAVHSS